MKSHTGLSSFYLSCERAKAANFVSVLLSANCKPRFLLFGYGRRTDISLTIRGIRARISQELDVVAFQSWKLDAVAFCPLKKSLGITMPWLICHRFLMSWCLVPESRCRGFLVLESRCHGSLVLESRFRGIYASTASFSLSS